jgi:hypothetical protein
MGIIGIRVNRGYLYNVIKTKAILKTHLNIIS